jgi:hypothetical protein
MKEILDLCDKLNQKDDQRFQLDAHGRVWKRKETGEWEELKEESEWKRNR